MMTTKKTILTIAIIAAMPFGAWADYTYNIVNTPARVANNGTITRARLNGPYVTATIGDDDDEHIASTAYVKGAYNDAIAGMNAMANEFEGSLEMLIENLNSKGVDIWTTWEDDEAITQISLSQIE